MAYYLMTLLIKKKKPKAELIKKCNVYYAAGQLSDEEYTALMEIINAMED